jgi:indole-3-acetate monooxygenase
MREVDMNTIVDLEPLEAVRTVGPLIRDHAEQAERERRVAATVIEAMKVAGLFRLLTPRSLGGLEVDPLTFAHTIEEVGRIDSAAAWALCNPNSVAWWCGRLPDEGIEEIHARGPNTIIAAAFHPPVEATAVTGGFRLSGRRPLASGIHDASWLMLTAVVLEEGRPRLRTAAKKSSPRSCPPKTRASSTRGTRSGCAVLTATTWR